MDDAARHRLNQLNHCFYGGPGAARFSDTRQTAWPGWSRLDAQLALPAAPRVVDVGCGNGRYARHLAQRRPGARYLGLDLSAPLLREARRAAASLSSCALLRLDLLREGLAPLGRGRFDLAVAWGLLHHVPGLEARCALLHTLASHLAPGGFLAFSVWRPHRLPADRLLSPGRLGLSPGAWEPGDHVLAWQGDAAALRYVHLSDAREIEQLIDATRLGLLQRWDGAPHEGDQNHYVLLRRR